MQSLGDEGKSSRFSVMRENLIYFENSRVEWDTYIFLGVLKIMFIVPKRMNMIILYMVIITLYMVTRDWIMKNKSKCARPNNRKI